MFQNEENDAPDVTAPVIPEDDGAPVLPYTYQLKQPIVIKGNNGKEIKRDELVFKNRLTFRMQAHLPIGGADTWKRGHLLPMIAGMTGEDPIVINALDASDVDDVAVIVFKFFR